MTPPHFAAKEDIDKTKHRTEQRKNVLFKEVNTTSSSNRTVTFIEREMAVSRTWIHQKKKAFEGNAPLCGFSASTSHNLATQESMCHKSCDPPVTLLGAPEHRKMERYTSILQKKLYATHGCYKWRFSDFKSNKTQQTGISLLLRAPNRNTTNYETIAAEGNLCVYKKFKLIRTEA